MAEEKKKDIPIEDGGEAEEKVAKEEVVEAEAEAEAEAESEETRSDRGAQETESEEEKTDASTKKAEKEAEDEPSIEEQESERYMRLMAEFQNFKRRAAKEKTDIHAFANERIVNDLLPVLDNFERALEGGSTDGETSPATNEELANYVKGMELIFEQLKAALEKAGLKEIEALGCDFDPNVHNAVMTDQTDEYEDGKVSKVMQKGYKLNDKVVRPSMVAVNKK